MGGGTAGLVVASRLASDPRNSVAVIEAGSFYEISNGNVSQIPAFVSYNSSPLVDWGFVTSPQPVSIIEGRSHFLVVGHRVYASFTSGLERACHKICSRQVSGWEVSIVDIVFHTHGE